MTILTNPAYGAIPPTGAAGQSGQVLTTTSSTGSTWLSHSTNLSPNAIQIGAHDPAITFAMDGTIKTRAGTITAEDWIMVVKLMKRFIMDVANDPETASKYPYMKDAAHTWLIDELKGKK